MKKHRRIFALILAVLLLFSAIVFVSAEPEEQEVVRLGEVQSLRETNSETYLLSDGSYECVVYAQDKYYLDDSDTLQLIDHTIKAETSGLNTTYTNTANSFDVDFSGSGTPQVSIAYEGNSITFSPLSDISLDNPITANAHVARIGRVDNCLTLESLTPTGSNTVTYEDAFTSTDLVYVLDNNGLKEYIILRDGNAPNEFQFMFQMDGVEMQTIENETFFMDAEGKSVFQMGQLFAVDGANELTNELTYSFTPVKGDTNVIVTVTLSEDYLSDPARVFPVVIDPSIMISSVQTADTCVMSRYGDGNYYTSNYLRTGYDSDYRIRRSFIRFDIPSSIPAGSVESATLDLETCGGVAPTIRAHRCMESWTSSTVTWLDQPNSSSLHYSGLSVPYREGSAWYVMDVTSIVQTWVNGTYANYGFALKDVTENDPDHWTTYYSSDMESPHKPELHITYESDPDEPPPVVTPTLTLNKSSMEIDVGSTGTITATTYPSTTVTWSSANTSVATVSSNGMVTARGLGSVTIIASANGLSAYCTVYVTIPDGTYFIRNKYSDKYADIVGGNMASGTAIQQQTYDGEDTQRWRITHLGDCVYSIRSANSTSAYYMGVSGDSIAANQPVVLDTSLSMGSRWKIWETSSGAYKLVPLTGQSAGYALALASTSTANGIALQQRAYTNDSNYSDEWLIYQNNPCNISVYFSDAYENKKGSASAAISAISLELEELKDKYQELFRISLNFGTPTNMTTYGDACPNISNNGASVCNCTDDSYCTNTWSEYYDPLHHTNQHHILHDITAPSGSVSAKIVYLGHELCYKYGGAHGTRLGAIHIETSILLLSYQENASKKILTLVHEIGHIFGAPDHYDLIADGYDDLNYTTEEASNELGAAFNDNCIYGQNRMEVGDDLTICAGCQEQIRKNANKYFEES